MSIKSLTIEKKVICSLINWCYDISVNVMLLQQLSKEDFRIENLFKVYGQPLSILWSLCENFPQLFVINNPSIPCQK